MNAPDSTPSSGLILYQTEDGQTRVQCRFEDESIWLTQAQMAELFQTTPQNITLHLKAIFEEGELSEEATCKDYLQVRREGGREAVEGLRTGAAEWAAYIVQRATEDEQQLLPACRFSVPCPIGILVFHAGQEFSCDEHEGGVFNQSNRREGMNEVTRILNAVRQGQPQADDELMNAVYAKLRRIADAKMAQERPGHTLQGTALVHEAWLRLGDQTFENQAHFFSAAAEAMRRILVDRARRNACDKRGGGAEHVDLAGLEIAAPLPDEDELLALHEALDRLAEEDPRKAELVKLRYFAGLSFDEAAEVLGVSVATAKRDWAYARAWLYSSITSTG